MDGGNKGQSTNSSGKPTKGVGYGIVLLIIILCLVFLPKILKSMSSPTAYVIGPSDPRYAEVMKPFTEAQDARVANAREFFNQKQEQLEKTPSQTETIGEQSKLGWITGVAVVGVINPSTIIETSTLRCVSKINEFFDFCKEIWYDGKVDYKEGEPCNYYMNGHAFSYDKDVILDCYMSEGDYVCKYELRCTGNVPESTRYKFEETVQFEDLGGMDKDTELLLKRVGFYGTDGYMFPNFRVLSYPGDFKKDGDVYKKGYDTNMYDMFSEKGIHYTFVIQEEDVTA